MEFKKEALLEREIEIADFLLQDFSLSQIAGRLEINKKIVKAHIRNMMQKLNAENIKDLMQSLKAKQQEQK